MTNKDKISLSLTGLLVVCALIITALVVRQQFFPLKQQPRKRQVKKWKQLNLNGARTGPQDAPVQIVEFFDYQCPFCKQAQPAVKAIKKKYNKQVAVVYENYLLPAHTYAFRAAIAAECARRQGAFGAYHDSLFANQTKLGKSSFYTGLAGRTDITNQAAFIQCLAKRKTTNIVKAGKSLGKKLGVSGIPTFLINGTLVAGALVETRLEALVKQQLAQAGG